MACGVRRYPPGQRQLLVQRGPLMIELGLVVARLLHYAAVTTLAGVSFFPLYAYADPEPIMLLRWRKGVLLAAAVAALLSGVAWFVFSVANMSGTLTDVADREVLWTVLNETTFGDVWQSLDGANASRRHCSQRDSSSLRFDGGPTAGLDHGTPDGSAAGVPGWV